MQDTILHAVSRDGLAGEMPNIFMVGDANRVFTGSVAHVLNCLPKNFCHTIKKRERYTAELICRRTSEAEKLC